MNGFFYDDCVMAIPTKQLNELKRLLDELGLKYKDQDLPVIAFNIAKFVLVSEVHKNTIQDSREDT